MMVDHKNLIFCNPLGFLHSFPDISTVVVYTTTTLEFEMLSISIIYCSYYPPHQVVALLLLLLLFQYISYMGKECGLRTV